MQTHIFVKQAAVDQLTVVFRALYGQYAGPAHFVNESNAEGIAYKKDTRQVDQQRQACYISSFWYWGSMLLLGQPGYNIGCETTRED